MSWSEYFDVIGWFVKSRRAWIYKEYKGREEEKNCYFNLKTKEIFYTYYFSNVICNVHHSDNHTQKFSDITVCFAADWVTTTYWCYEHCVRSVVTSGWICQSTTGAWHSWLTANMAILLMGTSCTSHCKFTVFSRNVLESATPTKFGYYLWNSEWFSMVSSRCDDNLTFLPQTSSKSV